MLHKRIPESKNGHHTPAIFLNDLSNDNPHHGIEDKKKTSQLYELFMILIHHFVCVIN